MVTQLLEITHIPLKYELQITHPRLEIDQQYQPKSEIQTAHAKLNLQTTQTTSQYDSYEMRHSLGFNDSTDLLKANAEKGKESLAKTTEGYVQIGQEMSQIDQNVSIPDIMREKMFQSDDGGSLYTAFLPDTGTDITWQPGGVNVDYQPAQLQVDWNVQKPQYTYIPGEVHLEILQQAKIEIQYLGGPRYYPPSSDPDYQEVEEVG